MNILTSEEILGMKQKAMAGESLSFNQIERLLYTVETMIIELRTRNPREIELPVNNKYPADKDWIDPPLGFEDEK